MRSEFASCVASIEMDTWIVRFMRKPNYRWSYDYRLANRIESYQCSANMRRHRFRALSGVFLKSFQLKGVLNTSYLIFTYVLFLESLGTGLATITDVENQELKPTHPHPPPERKSGKVLPFYQALFSHIGFWKICGIYNHTYTIVCLNTEKEVTAESSHIAHFTSKLIE